MQCTQSYHVCTGILWGVPVGTSKYRESRLRLPDFYVLQSVPFPHPPRRKKRPSRGAFFVRGKSSMKLLEQRLDETVKLGLGEVPLIPFGDERLQKRYPDRREIVLIHAKLVVMNDNDSQGWDRNAPRAVKARGDSLQPAERYRKGRYIFCEK